LKFGSCAANVVLWQLRFQFIQIRVKGEWGFNDSKEDWNCGEINSENPSPVNKIEILRSFTASINSWSRIEESGDRQTAADSLTNLGLIMNSKG